MAAMHRPGPHRGDARLRLGPTLFCIVVGLLFALPIAAKVRPPVTSAGYDLDVQTRSFDVLAIDFDQAHVLFRHVYALRGDPSRHLAAGVDCAYDGLEPGFFEVWGVYDAADDALLRVMPIRAPARTKDACLTASDVGAREKAAQEEAGRLGLKVAKKSPPAIRPSGRGDSFRLSTAQGPLVLRGLSRRTIPEDVQQESGLAQAKSPVALARLLAGDRIVYSRYQALDDARDVGREMAIGALFVSPDKTRIIALERFDHRPQPDVAYTYFSFSPPVPVTGLGQKNEKLAKEPLPPPEQPLAGPDPEEEGGGCCSLCGLGACACVGLPALFAGGCGCALFENWCGPCLNFALFKGPKEPPEPLDEPAPPGEDKNPDKKKEPDEGQWAFAVPDAFLY